MSPRKSTRRRIVLTLDQRLARHVAAREAQFRHHEMQSFFVDDMVERLAASGGPFSKATAKLSARYEMPSRRLPGIRRFLRCHATVARVVQDRRNASLAVNHRKAAKSGLTSLFTKLRLPNRKTRPPLRTVVTLAPRRREHRAPTGAGRGTCFWPKSANPGAVAPGLVLCRR